MTELQIERPKLIEAARRSLHRIEIAEEIISRLDDVIDEERRSFYGEHFTLRAILERAGLPVPSDPGDYRSAAQRLVDEAAS